MGCDCRLGGGTHQSINFEQDFIARFNNVCQPANQLQALLDSPVNFVLVVTIAFGYYPNRLTISVILHGTRAGFVPCFMAVSGSFKPWPVKTQTIVEPSGILPALCNFKVPATEAAEAGSQKMPSLAAITL